MNTIAILACCDTKLNEMLFLRNYFLTQNIDTLFLDISLGPDVPEVENRITREELIAAARRCSESGMQSGNGGNFSARIPGTEEMYVKARDTAFSEVSARSVVRTDFAGNLLAGELRPSKESLLHGVIYRACPEIHAIMHCHSPYATAWASTGKPLPFVTYHSKLKLKSEVPVFDTNSYVVPESYFPQILSLFEKAPETSAFLLRGHGLVAVGKTVREALFRAELIEETAHIAILEHLLTGFSPNIALELKL